MCYSHRRIQPIPISNTYWLRSRILRYPLQQKSSIEGFVCACYYHHFSQPHTDGNTTQPPAFSLSVARLGDGFGLATHSANTMLVVLVPLADKHLFKVCPKWKGEQKILWARSEEGDRAVEEPVEDPRALRP